MEESLRCALAPYNDLAVAILYGSWAAARQRSDSDVDLAVAFDVALTFDERVTMQLHLEQRIGREIDLVDLAQAHGLLLNEILTQGKVVIKRNSVIYARYLARMWYENADFMPQYNYILEQRRKRFINETSTG